MAGRFMKIKRFVIPTMTMLLLASQIAGCTVVDSKQFVEMIDAGDTVVIELAEPKYEIEVQGEVEQAAEWVQLDSLRTYGIFRQ